VSFQVAIPSYARPRTVVEKSLTMLRRQQVDLDRVIVWVANEEQRELYLAERPEARVEVAALGIRAARNHIQRAYPEGTNLLAIDDDVSSVYEKDGDQGRAEIPDLSAWVSEAFARMARERITLAGVHPVDNPFFLKHSVTTDLRFVIGTMHLVKTTQEEWGQLTLDEKEDVEQTLIRFCRDGAVLRWNGVGLKTNTRTEPGGLQTLGAEERKARNEESARALAARYPGMAILRYRKNGLPEIRLKSPRGNG
jgi:hypothetical protein